MGELIPLIVVVAIIYFVFRSFRRRTGGSSNDSTFYPYTDADGTTHYRNDNDDGADDSGGDSGGDGGGDSGGDGGGDGGGD